MVRILVTFSSIFNSVVVTFGFTESDKIGNEEDGFITVEIERDHMTANQVTLEAVPVEYSSVTNTNISLPRILQFDSNNNVAIGMFS